MQTTRTTTSVVATLAAALMLFLASAQMISAHGGFEHVLGVVTKVSAASVTVETAAKKSVEVVVNAKTTYARGDKALTAGDLKVGDRVVIDAKPENSKLVAASVKIGAASKISVVDHSAHQSK